MKNLFCLILGILLVAGCKEKKENSLENKSAENSKPIPLKSINEDSINIKVFNFENFQPLLHKNNDSIYIVNFWATWCKPCVEELPGIENIQQEYKDKKVKVILTSLDFPGKIKS